MVPIEIKLTGDPFKGLKRELPGAMRDGLGKAGAKWHREFLLGHFELRAVAKYGYTMRSKHYMLKKSRRCHHQKPLVFTGNMRDALVRAATIRPTSHNVKVDMLGPKWLKGFIAMRGRYGTGPNKLAEITAVTNEELLSLANAVAARVAERLEQVRAALGAQA